MNLVFIYGPPAVGKLTVAKELSKLTGYKLFHNHLSVDLITSIFDFGTKPFFRLNDKIRIEIFKTATKNNIKGIIFTCCISSPSDDDFVNKVISAVEINGGKVNFVHLYCSKERLKERVGLPSRKKFGKLMDKDKLEQVVDEWNLLAPISFVQNLGIDNTDILAEDVAKKIKEHYEL